MNEWWPSYSNDLRKSWKNGGRDKEVKEKKKEEKNRGATGRDE